MNEGCPILLALHQTRDFEAQLAQARDMGERLSSPLDIDAHVLTLLSSLLHCHDAATAVRVSPRTSPLSSDISAIDTGVNAVEALLLASRRHELASSGQHGNTPLQGTPPMVSSD